MQQTINNKYQFDTATDKLGSGGFGDVYRATDIVLKRTVALKFFTRNLDSSRDVITEVSSFINNRLRHDHIIEYYDAFYYETTDRFGNPLKEQVAVLEYANGGTLIDQLPRLYTDPEFRKMVIGDILKGLAYLGNENVVHRDLKPANVFLHTKPNGKMVAKIGDFGLMKVANTEQSTSRNFSTPEYTAPEQLNLDKYGHRATPNAKPQLQPNCDLWALGVMIYRFFTQELPFGSQETTDTGEIIRRILSHSTQPLDYSRIPPPYRAIVERCLISNANQRAQNADELLHLLNSSEITTAPPPQYKDHSEETTITHKPQNKPRHEIPTITVAPPADTPKPETNYTRYGLIGVGVLLLVAFMFWVDSGGSNNAPETTSSEIQQTAPDSTAEVTNTTFETPTTTTTTLTTEAKEEKAKAPPPTPIPEPVKESPTATTPIPEPVKESPTVTNPKPEPVKESPTAADPFAAQMVLIQGGTFMMGSPESEADRSNNEYQHQVSVSSFKMSKYEVTQAQWEAIMGNNPGYFKGCAQCPVENVSWDDIQDFLQRLNAKTGKNYRLPTEAEWEYAARGGTSTPFYTGNCLSTDQANYDGNYPYQTCAKGKYRGKTTPVGSYAPNKYGLYDLHGNVWEWCSDWYGKDYYNNSPANNPKGPSTGSSRVLRGGSWGNDARYCRSAIRNRSSPSYRIDYDGFRLVFVPQF
jgi:formylglycine-generating enzyme required for sulfatase activity